MIVFLGATCWENTGWWSYPKKKSIRIIKVQEQHLKICQWRAKNMSGWKWTKTSSNIEFWIPLFGFLAALATPKHVLYPTTNKGILRPPNMWSSMWLSEELWVQWHPWKKMIGRLSFPLGKVTLFRVYLQLWRGTTQDSRLIPVHSLVLSPHTKWILFWCLIPPDSCFSAAWLGWLISPHAHA